MDLHDESVLTRPTETTVAFHLLGQPGYLACRELERELAEQASLLGRATILLCEHAPLITVGRQGSWGDIGMTIAELQRRGSNLEKACRDGAWLLLYRRCAGRQRR